MHKYSEILTRSHEQSDFFRNMDCEYANVSFVWLCVHV